MLIKTIISYDISICHLKRTKILYIFIYILYFQNFYAIYLCIPQMFIQLLLFKYANVILTEKKMYDFNFLRRAYDDQRNAGSP